MSPRDWKDFVQDSLDAIQEIFMFTAGMSFDAFRSDIKTIRAVELNFIIIGEAVSAIPEAVQEAYPEIPWHFMRAMRNRLVHVYFEVDAKLVWDTVKNDLPSLTTALEELAK